MITGISRRLGLLACQSYLAKGDSVLGITRFINDDIKVLMARYPDSFEVCECVNYDANGVALIANQFVNSGVDVLINNASFFVEDAQEIKHKAAQYQIFYETHMLFPLLLSEWFATQKSSDVSGDRLIINMSDIYALKPTFDRAMYCSTKAGLENLTQSLAAKFAPKIRVNSIQPGPLAFLPEHSDSEKSNVLQQTPLAKEGGFEVIIETFDFLIHNQFITGSTIKVDGGRSLIR